MVWFGLTSLKFPNPLLLKIVNNVLILRQDVLQMCLFGKLLVILVSSHKFLTRVWSSSLQAHHAYSTLKRHGHYHVASTWNTRDVFVGLRFIRCCNKNLLKIVENWTARHFKGPRYIMLLNSHKNYLEMQHPLIFRCQWYGHQTFKFFILIRILQYWPNELYINSGFKKIALPRFHVAFLDCK